MNERMRAHADYIVREAIRAVLPEEATGQALKSVRLSGRVRLLAVGKAACRMAGAAHEALGEKIERGLIVTKYGHAREHALPYDVIEAGHPLPDENSLRAAEAALCLTEGLDEGDTLLFLLSGGGSALMEKPLVPLKELLDIHARLLACGANINEINTVRKRLSAIKGGRFALHCRPARVEAVILSDVLGDCIDMIASGPTCPDSSTSADALAVIRKYGLPLSADALRLLEKETPKALDNVHNLLCGSVRLLCRAAADACQRLGYTPTILTDMLDCEAREAGAFLAAIAKSHACDERPTAFIAGGETVVHVKGNGLGGRNQELALSGARGIAALKNAALFSLGSDGTDGPTDAAGGYVDGDTMAALTQKGIDADAALLNNDSYHALKAAGGLLFTGPTGTNVNDVAVALIAGGD